MDARDADRYDDDAALFTPDAVVVDDGHTYAGRDAVSAWILDASSAFEYTAIRISQDIRDETTDVQVRLNGNFPGGTVSLRYRFELADGGIRDLTIGAGSLPNT